MASSRPRTTLATARSTTLSVVTLMPPPVPPGAAPMNMSRDMKILAKFVISPSGMLL